MIVLLLALACTDWFASTDTDTSADTDTASADTADSGEDATERAADDARVRALTDLPGGEFPCLDPMLVRVAYITDGDTVYVHPEDGSAGRKVRLIGIDTPEIEHDDPAECFGEEAMGYTSEALLERLVWLTFDSDCIDPYDRTLAYVFRDQGEAGFFNRVLARQGYATALAIDPNTTFEAEIDADVREAQREGAGMWEACP